MFLLLNCNEFILPVKKIAKGDLSWERGREMKEVGEGKLQRVQTTPQTGVRVYQNVLARARLPTVVL